MISETRFAKSYGSIWRSLAPTLELFVRKANLRLLERGWTPIASSAQPGLRALINQVAFEVMKLAVAEPGNHAARLADREIASECERRLCGRNVLSEQDQSEALTIAHRMHRNIFTRSNGSVILSPTIQGCGLINVCEADAITETHKIIELKDGDRAFRSYEFRQLIVYSALWLNETGVIASEIEVINSRRGVSVSIPLEEFSNEVAGQSAFDLLSEVIRTITDHTNYQN